MSSNVAGQRLECREPKVSRGLLNPSIPLSAASSRRSVNFSSTRMPRPVAAFNRFTSDRRHRHSTRPWHRAILFDPKNHPGGYRTQS
jgi:hypothetical protein